MADAPQQLTGPDLKAGVSRSELAEGTPFLGHADSEPVLLVRRGATVHAVGASCTHYGGPLADGLVVGDTVRCPWHHACFSLTTGEAVGAPALNPLARWIVAEEGEVVRVVGKEEPTWPAERPTRTPRSNPESVVIVGGGAAGEAAAEELRKQGYAGKISIVDPDPDAPYDRPNLSKDYLAGTAPEEWIPLHPADFYRTLEIELVRDRVAAIDRKGGTVSLERGGTLGYGALLLAPGSAPIELSLGDGPPAVHYLRTLADSRAIIRAAGRARRAVVLGASFIGLEVAASLRAREVEVHVVAPERRLFERVLGGELGDFVRGLHESKGVVFHLGLTAKSVAGGEVVLSDGCRLAADLVVAGVGVRPRVELAEAAGLPVDRGILVDRFLEAAPGVFVAGDAARYPDPLGGEPIRIEHWAAAQRQGQAAARNILGAEEPFADVPFFWSAHYDATIAYVGHAARWDRAELEGDPASYDCTVRYHVGDTVRAVATIYRDRESLEFEARMEEEARRRA
ncbi:MAG: FAD-dependent oxidoreductase [Gemmatimonadales bacterium]